MDIEIHFEKNNVKTMAKEKLRRMGRIVPVWIAREWYPQSGEPMPNKEQIKLLRQRTTDELNEKRRMIGAQGFLRLRKRAIERWEDERMFSDELLGLITRAVIAENKNQIDRKSVV